MINLPRQVKVETFLSFFISVVLTESDKPLSGVLQVLNHKALGNAFCNPHKGKEDVLKQPAG